MVWEVGSRRNLSSSFLISPGSMSSSFGMEEGGVEIVSKFCGEWKPKSLGYISDSPKTVARIGFMFVTAYHKGMTITLEAMTITLNESLQYLDSTGDMGAFGREHIVTPTQRPSS